MNVKIKDIIPRQILDQHGNPTVDVELILSDNSKHFASVPAIADSSDMKEIRDSSASDKYNGKGVIQALVNIDIMITPNLIGIDPQEQKRIDTIIRGMDTSDSLSTVGANSALAVSMAVLKAGAYAAQMPLYSYVSKILRDEYAVVFPPNLVFPTPVIVALEGGKNNGNNLAINQFTIIPIGISDIREKIRAGSEITHQLRNLLIAKGLNTGTGLNGGFIPNLESDQTAIDLITEAITLAKYKPGEDVGIGLKIDMSEYYIKERQLYELPHQLINNKTITVQGQTKEITEFYINLVTNNPIIAIENGYHDDDWIGYSTLNPFMEVQKKFCITDTLTNNNDELIVKAVRANSANVVSISPQNNGLMSKMFDIIKLCKESDLKIMLADDTSSISDPLISHLAIGAQSSFIKVGSLHNSYGIDKLNELMRMITPEMAKKILQID